jgi:hypothetical protein
MYLKAWWVKISLTPLTKNTWRPLPFPRYNIMSMAQQHSANSVQHHAPRVFRPITFTNTQGCHIAPHRAINHMPMANAVISQDTGAGLEYRQLIQDETALPIWNKASANGRLNQGVGGRIEGSNTIFFIPRQVIQKGKVVAYGHFVVDIRPHKSETHRFRLTVGGTLIEYPGDVSTRSTDLTTSKCLWNSTISTDGAKNMCLEVKIFSWAPQWTRLNTCASPSNSSLNKSLQNITYSPWCCMDTFILKCRNACTPPSRHSREPTPCPPSSHPWLPPNQRHTRSMAPCSTPH